MALGVDIGGTKIAVGIGNSDGEILSQQSHSVPKTKDPEEIFDLVEKLIQNVMGTLSFDISDRSISDHFACCGVGCGGPMDRVKGIVSPVNIAAWRQFPLKSRLESKLPFPVFVDNDAKALALGEGWKGGALGKLDYMAMVVSTGVGGGIVLDGKLLDGRLGNAGHIGHIIVEPTGRQCGCGAFGCLEAEASGTAVYAITGVEPKDAPDEIKERCGTMVGRAVASVSNLLDLDLVLVAGSVALGYGEIFFSAANKEARQRARLDFSKDIVIRPGGLLDSGPLIGAMSVGWSGLEAGST
ncbi:MAG: ROK family protein [Acidimicrobiales bacterium]|nr:ROK family protein [Acidimicrobiales bacterium]